MYSQNPSFGHVAFDVGLSLLLLIALGCLVYALLGLFGVIGGGSRYPECSPTENTRVLMVGKVPVAQRQYTCWYNQ